MNIRELIPESRAYFKINREERYFAALLYSVLLQRGENLSRFLDHLRSKLRDNNGLPTTDPDSCELYFEYTYLRDLWCTINNNNELKRNIVLKSLTLSNSSQLQEMRPADFNTFFGAGRIKASLGEIMSPATWAITKFSTNITNNDEFLRTCKFKWCFNAKPDLVIQIHPDHAICIEAKFESSEGTYPSSFKDKEIFTERRLQHVSQISLQQYMFKELLGMKVTHFFLTKRDSTQPNSITWNEIFATLSLENLHPFVYKALQSTKIVK